jgi:D-lactate dehydrogenase
MQLKNRLDHFAMAPHRSGRTTISSTHTRQRGRAPDALAAGTPQRLRDDLVALLGADRVLTRPIDLVRFATDASPYRLFPKAIVALATWTTCAECSNMGGQSMRA